MPLVDFKPAGRTVTVDEGITLLDAAHLAGIILAAPCGGKGTCGKCRVAIVSGKPAAAGQADDGMVLACRTLVGSEDLTVEVPEQDLSSYDRFEETAPFQKIITEQVPQRDGGVEILSATVEAPQPEDGLSDVDRLYRALGEELFFTREALAGLPETLREDEGRVHCAVASKTILLTASDAVDSLCALAVDLGTTTVSVALLELESGKVLSAKSAYNAQVNSGLDIISRINFSRGMERIDILRRQALGTINTLLGDLLAGCGVPAERVVQGALSGNTVMTHLLLGINPEHIRLEPYTPAFLSLDTQRAGDIGIEINTGAPVYLSPAVGSYVGGDITAGMLVSDMRGNGEDICLFIDIGTNGEIVLGNDDFLMTCACSAGPAFEGGELSCGMRASGGAINRVSFDPLSKTHEFTIIDNTEPVGICGSGIIDALAGMLESGIMDPSGKLVDGSTEHVVREGKELRYLLEKDGSVYVSERDISSILRAKGAIYSAIDLLCSHVGVGVNDIARVFVAGGFGQYLNLQKAISLGMLPDIPREHYHYLGNASLAGTCLLALSENHRQKQHETASRMTYMDLSNDPAYMDHYTAALFFPHTDTTRFPSYSGRQ